MGIDRGDAKEDAELGKMEARVRAEVAERVLDAGSIPSADISAPPRLRAAAIGSRPQ